MSYIPTTKGQNEVPEESAVPGDKEYDVAIIAVGEAYVKEETGRTVLPLTIQIEDPDYPDAKLVGHWLTFPTEDDKENEPRKFAMLARGINRFNALFGVTPAEDGINTEDYEGAKGRCVLTTEEYNGELNNKLRLPRIRGEED